MSGGFADLALDSLLALEAGRIGEIRISAAEDGRFSLSHRDDVGRDDLTGSEDPYAAAGIACYDDSGNYRPLKTAPNLRHGWRLSVTGRESLAIALNLFYPARLAAYSAWKREALATTSLRETFGRQTGMYRAVAQVSEEQVNQLVGNFCRSDGGCLRTILWKRNSAGAVSSTLLPAQKFGGSFDQTGRGEAMIPLLCQEACNLLVAEARKLLQSSPKTETA